MYPSLVQTSSLALALSLVTSAQQIPINSPSIPEQRPIHNRPYVSEEGSNSGVILDAARNATIKLFPASTMGFRPMFSFGCRESTFNTITLETDVCLSGDYYLSHNMLITEAPTCPDGKKPTMTYYHRQGCRGETAYRSDESGRGIPEYCLWGGHSPKEWSMIFRCGDDTEDMEDRVSEMESTETRHQIAVPPPAPEPLHIFDDVDKTEPKDEPIALEEPTDGVVYTHLFPECNGRRVGGHKPMTVPVDRCLTIHGFGIQFKTPAVCSNGTRAKWARFEDSKCGYGEISSTYGLIDIKDSDIMKCLSTGTFGDGEKVSSMSFWCEGFGNVTKPDPNAPKEPEVPKPAKGSVSESACGNRAPFFSHPSTDTCVDLKTDMMKIYSTGVCANGTSALLTKYEKKGCAGNPASFVEVTKERGNLEKCLDFQGTGSFALWCDGKGIVGPVPNNPGRSKSDSRTSPVLVVVLVIIAGVLVAMLGAWAWFTTDLRVKVQELFGRKEGGIAL
ncbi:hypothetical protein BKA64DRAFT_440938 [Cadophora sp. MPI-SDFR-AT-0126]|nr:hypothetical protein BKA64DRAFT_440938 [Leotiomycetes sp. MPI-SDFR-AT-0126]